MCSLGSENTFEWGEVNWSAHLITIDRLTIYYSIISLLETINSFTFKFNNLIICIFYSERSIQVFSKKVEKVDV